MAIQKKAKRSSASPRKSVALTKGDWLDVMDQDGVWTVARVLSVPSPEEVEVMYDGWPEEYDEVVRVDSDRVAPFHTFTWAVKCWVKYLNWPMWPSVITIRTPGNEDGIKNLELENRLYVDFLDHPNFARRDRCWQTKRQVKRFDDNFDGKRTGTNGGQFERALACFLLSDATTKMPKFAKGTLPMQYENSTTESVEWMRKSMGKGLWYKNFANNKERHMRTHKYETNSDDDDNNESSAGDDEAVPVANLKGRGPEQRAASEESDVAVPPKKKKRALSAKKTHQSVEIKPESSAGTEVPYELESMESSSDSESDREKEVALKKRKRLQVKTRAAVSPVAGKKQSSSSQNSNVASAMPRHVTVAMDEIIVDDDDDDSDSSEAARTRKSKKTARSPARKPRPSRVKREVSSPSPSKSRSKAKEISLETRVEPAAQRTNIIDSRSEEDEDESDGSNSFDVGTTSEDKNASPVGSQFGFRSPTAMSYSNGKATVAESEPAHSQPHSRVTTQNLTSSPRLTKKKIYAKGQTKLGARRSIPPLSRDLSLAASPKARPIRSSSSDDDDSEEDKGVPKAAAKDVARGEVKPTQDIQRSKQLRQNIGESGGAPSQISSKQSRPSKRPKAPQSLVEQRIAFAQEVLRDLERQKQRETANIAAKKRQTMTSPLSAAPDRSRQSVVKPRRHQRNDSDVSFVQGAGKGSRLSSALGGQGDSQGRLPATLSELDSVSRNLSHSFLSVDAAYSSDSQDSKSVPPQLDGDGLTPFDEPVDFESDPKESKRAKNAEVRPLAEAKDSDDAKQLAEDEASEDDSGDEKSQEVRRSFCVMRAGLEDERAVEEGEAVRVSKRTVISMPRKFKKPVKGALSGVITSSKDSTLQIEAQPDDVPAPTVVFCSSEGFTMATWLRERTLFGSYRNEGA